MSPARAPPAGSSPSATAPVRASRRSTSSRRSSRLSGRGGPLARVRGPLVLGGRSAGARVACRTAGVVGAGAVLCLSFPLHAPGKPHVSRADELGVPLGAGLPVHVVQGERDPFGGPAEVLAAQPALAGRVHPVPGTHTIARAGGPLVAEAVRLALADLLFWE